MKKLAAKSVKKNNRYARRKHRCNTIAKTVTQRPRLIVNRSNKHISVQIVDRTGKVIASANDASIKSGTKMEKAFSVGESLAKEALSAGCEQVVFDRNGFLFHGRVKQLAEGVKSGGLKL